MEWVADVLARFIANGSEKTVIDIARGRRSARPIAQFGEQVLYLPTKATDQAANKSGGEFSAPTRSYWVRTDVRTVKARAIRIMRPDLQWNAE